MTQCKYRGDCHYKADKCTNSQACAHQDAVKNTASIRVGPCQDGMWYTVDNKNYIAKEKNT